MKNYLLSCAAVLIVTQGSMAADTVRIACVGNSITYGYGFNTPVQRDTGAYPGLLKKALRTVYMTGSIPTVIDTVFNWGVSSTTLQKKGNVPYWTCANFQKVFTCRPAIVTVCLGTNDTKPTNWNESIGSSTQFSADYQAMIDTFSHIATRPKVIACLPPACSNNNQYGIHDSVLSKYIVPRIRAVALTNNIPVADLHTPFLKHVNFAGSQSGFWYTADGVHPLDSGQRELADIFYETIINSSYAVTPVVRKMPFSLRLLWYGYSPRATGNDTLAKPMLYVFPAPDSIRTPLAALVVAGGGYTTIALDTEGFAVAQWLQRNGINAFVLRYRYQPYRYPVPMLDVSRAMRLIRYHAQNYRLDTTKIGIIGFSAGGHLASWLATHFDNGNSSSQDSIERKKSRPDWSILAYPVITMSGSFVETGSRNALVGGSPAAVLLDTLSNQKWVTPQTPKTFLSHGDADNLVPIQNSRLYDSALRANGVAEKLLVETGKAHGYGLAAMWPDSALAWLKAQGILLATGTRNSDQSFHRQQPGFSVRVMADRLQITSASSAATKCSIYSVSGRRLYEVVLLPHRSTCWRPPVHAAYVVRMASGGSLP